jgi:hypothetical protein
MMLFVLCLIFYGINIYSQVKLEWEARYHFIKYDGGSSVVVDDSGYIYVTGASIQDQFLYNLDYVTIKYTPSGDTAWIRRWDWNNQYDGGDVILIDSVGNVYVAGTPVLLKYNSSGELLWESEQIAGFIRIQMDSKGNLYAAGTRTENYMTAKFSPDGEELWRRTYNGPGIPGNNVDIITDMAIDSKGNVVVTGRSHGGSGAHYDFATIKYSSNGDTLWIRRYNGPAQNQPLDAAYSMTIDDSDNIYVTGWSNGITGLPQCLTLKYNPSGELVWEKRFPEDNQISNTGYDIIIDRSEFIYVAGRTHGLSDWLICYDTDGNLLWYVQYPVSNLFYTNQPRLTLDKNKNIYMTSAGGEYTILKFNPSGEKIWEFSGIVGNAYAIFVDTSLNVFVTGEGSGNGADILTLKLSQGTVDISQDGDILPSEFQLFHSYPNPFNSATNITFTLPQSSDVDMRIYNILGEEMAALISEYCSAGKHTVQWDAGVLPSGMYLCKLQALNEQRVIKLLLMK